MNIPQLVIFDMDGLIFNTERLFMEQRAIVMKDYGYEHREEDYIKTLGLTGRELMDTLHHIYGPDYPAEEISKKSRQALNAYIAEHGPEVKPGIEKLLQWFRQKDILCCVASSTHRVYIEEYLKKAGLSDYFSYIVGGDEVRRSKPEPDIFLKACEHFDINPYHTLVLEDSENGILAAWNARISVVCIPDLLTPSVEMTRKTTGIVRTADEVISLFDM